MIKFLNVFLSIILVIILALLGWFLGSKDSFLAFWNKVFRPENNNVIVGTYKVVNTEDQVAYYLEITNDEVLVININPRLTRTGVVMPTDGTLVLPPVDLSEIEDKTFKLTDVLNDDKTITFELALAYGPYTLTPNFDEKKYTINSFGDMAKDWQVIDIERSEFDSLTK